MQDRSPVRAAIDIGSNTIHIVVARAIPNSLDILEDEVELVRIGESVNASGHISQEKADQAIAVLKNYKALAQKHSAEHIFTVATEAIRQAANGPDFLNRVKRATGLQVNIISGTAEATLTFYGATYEVYAQPNPPAEVGVMDLGGGSLELVTARNRTITWRTSIPIGSGWLHDRYLPGNPPAHDQIAVAETFLQTYFQGMPIKHRPPVLIVTGGSANSLLHLVHRAFNLELQQRQLTQHDLIRAQGLLSALPAAEIALRFEQPLGRARILLAGALIIQHVMSRLGLDEIHVSPHGIREGILLAYEWYGDSWLEAVSESSPDFHPGGQAHLQLAGRSIHALEEEPFAQAGRRMLHERLKKFLEWSGEVLKHEDIEAVHKMRVASRRLRATLDAFESCCDPKTFKRVYRQVKEAADLLGAARDTDVMIQDLQAQLAHMAGDERPGVEWLIARLETFRQEKQQELEKFLHALDADALKKQIDSCIPKGSASYGKS